VTNVKINIIKLKTLSRFMYCKKLYKTVIHIVIEQILTVLRLMTVGT